MKSQNNAYSIENAVAGLESWFETMRTAEGYGGPSIGLRGLSMRFCGAAFDWRCEGLLDGHVALFRATGDPAYLDRIDRDITDLCAAQLLNGTFRNSCFDQNPYEGGMPHEAANLAAACRARKLLIENGRTAPEALEQTLERFVETRLLNELWNRLLHTFNDWFQSSFETYTPHAVAAAIEVLIAYAEETGDWNRLERYILGAADSLLAAQISGGPLHGGMPLSNHTGSACSPTLAARCAPALQLVAQKTGQEKYATAARDLAEFVSKHTLPNGGFAALLYPNRPATSRPVLIGAAADAYNALERAGLSDSRQHPLEALLAETQLESGAFQNAQGYGDWRDLLPCCGWQDKIYSYLAHRHSGTAGAFAAADVSRTVKGKNYLETGSVIEITTRKNKPVYRWEKGSAWASICTL